MSAITGILHFDKQPISIEDGHNLMKAYHKFPADDITVWHQKNIYLGCHAQWITPESVGEKLPYYDFSRQMAITADVIIDNRDELFERLQIDLDQRKTMPDSQLILLAYCKWGKETPKYLHGDFAFMIWDEKQQKLFGARDFSGARTLYFYQDESRFAFSTLIQPLFTLPYVEKILNEEWLAEFLAIPNIVEAVDMFSTVYKSIQQIPPSHSITVVDGRITFSRYCTIEVTEELKLKSAEEYEEAFRDVLQKSVKARLRTHGEVGSHLSGGLDSGAVVSFAAAELKERNKKLHTYSSIPENSFIDWTPHYYIANEKPYIKATVNKVGNISDNYLGFNGQSPLTEIDEFLDIMEMPYKFFDNSFWLRGINKKASSDGVKILLNGARGNHSISWGSMTLTFNYYADLLKRFKWKRLSNELDDYCKNFNTGKSVMIPFIAKRAFSFLKTEQDNEPFPSLINPSLAARTNVFEKLNEYKMDISSRPIQDYTKYRHNYYNHLYVWNKSGVAGTKLSLRYSLWDRDPTNDLNVIRFCLALPEDQYTTAGMDRSIIRRAMKNRLPDKVRLNQDSRGLQGADVINRMSRDWGSFLNELDELINDPLAHEFINVEVIKKALLKIGDDLRPELIFEDQFKILPRSLVVYRFLKSVAN